MTDRRAPEGPIARVPELVAHRGYPLRYPENTLVGIEAAIQAGPRYLEVDVQLSADQVPVLFHDRTLERICGVTGAIHEHTLDGLERLRASAPKLLGRAFAHVAIPSLAELVHRLRDEPGITAFVEIKPVAVERFGLDVVLDRVLATIRPLEGRCVVTSFVPEVLPGARRRGWRRAGLVLKAWDQVRRGDVEAFAPEYLFCNLRKLPRRGGLDTLGCPLGVYDISDPGLALKLGRRGVALVLTFAIVEMLQHLRAAPPADARRL